MGTGVVEHGTTAGWPSWTPIENNSTWNGHVTSDAVCTDYRELYAALRLIRPNRR